MSLLHSLLLRDWITLHSLVVALGLGVYATASHTLKQRRQPAAGIAWVIGLVLLPYLALPLYLVFGNRKRASSRRRIGVLPAPNTAHPAQERLARAIGLGSAATFGQLQVHQDGRQALHALRSTLAQATQQLDVCTFILGRDVLGDEVAALLARQARAGVRVRLLLDGMGFYIGGHPNLQPLKEAGVQVALFVPPLQSPLRGRSNLRNHRKMVIADRQRLWCGGRNLAAEYFEGDPQSVIQTPVWTDLSFDLQGAVALQAQQLFDQDWQFATGGTATPTTPNAAPADNPAHALRARLVPSGPDQVEDTFYALLVSGCFTAQQRILVVTPYFVPDPALLLGLTLAARRGVAVTLVLPARSNHRLADIARRAALRELLAAGARVRLTPGMVHAKAVLIDHDLALVGSSNLDQRSLFLNYELMVAFEDPAVVTRFADWIDQLQGSATDYETRPPGLGRELVEGIVRWVAFQL
jgi:cardiolipin synthase